ncbi:lipopolysaccharide heptosyltransferase II [Thorsellia anophelis]|uniref:lipopolysaccharide heptosyltransferase II n=1 Tax=Thorsellia anophelis DSM 18579 TaxID=1123402 RepID=A0A1I0E4E0_9GAMM|nr:lipopolysaccharide heptosyltransferase II [Thorsellia anophelis]SET39095.1 heptosyltransferase-2 [Thorsellia anophelis DSM 18579]
MRILIIGPSWVGDMMMSQSLYRTIKALHPDAIIDVMAPTWSHALLARMPEVNKGIEMPLGHGALGLKARYHLGKTLSQNHYTHAYILPNSFKSALIPWFAKIKTRIGWRGEMRYGLLTDCRKLDKLAFVKMVDRYVALAYSADKIKTAKDIPSPILRPKLYVTQSEIKLVQEKFLPKAVINTLAERKKNGLIGFCPGAEFGPAKRWPDYHYAKLAETLIQQGHIIILFGSAKDAQIGEAIIEKLSSEAKNQCFNLAGITSLEEAICLIAGLDGMVTNDSGLMHIGAALDIPLVALYGPTSPEFTPPLSDNAVIIRLITGFIKIRKTGGESGYHQSLIDITPEQVIKTLIPLLERTHKSITESKRDV